MSQTIAIELEMPGELKRFKLPKSVNASPRSVNHEFNRDVVKPRRGVFGAERYRKRSAGIL